MPKSGSKNVASAVGRMHVEPEHASGAHEMTEQELAITESGSARKPQIDIVDRETIEVDDLDHRLGDEHNEDDALETATVATGRTVEAPVPDKQRPVGQTNDGVTIYGPVLKRFGPGLTVTLPAWEVRRLKELGFLVDPTKAIPAIQNGRAHIEQEGAHQFFKRQ